MAQGGKLCKCDALRLNPSSTKKKKKKKASLKGMFIPLVLPFWAETGELRSCQLPLPSKTKYTFQSL
jgi:hypothetical protein